MESTVSYMSLPPVLLCLAEIAQDLPAVAVKIVLSFALTGWKEVDKS